MSLLHLTVSGGDADSHWEVRSSDTTRGRPAWKGGSSTLRGLLGDLFERTGVNLYISGHDHDLQLNDSGQGWYQLVSGAGAKVRTTWWKENTLFAEARPGFCWVQLAPDEMVLHFVTAEGGSRFTQSLPRHR